MAGEAALRLAQLVGDELTIDAVGDGWPTQARIRVEGRQVPVDLFARTIISGARPARLDVERRFENPAQRKPIRITAGRVPLLLGLWTRDRRVAVPRPVIAIADAHKRAGFTTRFSVFQDLASLVEAGQRGWVTRENNDGELIRYLIPALLPNAVDAIGLDLPDELVQVGLEGAGLLADDQDDAARDRARRTTTAVVRDARFAKEVVTAYGGRCAMCGLGLNLVQAAHVYPAAAPGSHDKVWNGVALCANHHLAFDRHIVGVRLDDMAIVFHPDVLAQQATDPAVRALVAGSFARLAQPPDVRLRPRRAMFATRYEHFTSRYAWLAEG
jgi:hypothetical protein